VDVNLDECNYSTHTRNCEKRLRIIPNFLILVMGNVISLVKNPKAYREEESMDQ
jgi:hypothetical protein